MSESLHFASEKSGLPPGSLVHVGKAHAHTQVSVAHYNGAHLEMRPISCLEDILPYQNSNAITWVMVDGLQDVSLIGAIGQHFNIHALVLEDILNTHQRPKLEEFSDYLYIVMKAATLEPDTYTVSYEQISILLLHNFVFTFREKPSALFAPIFDRLNIPTSQLRGCGADYLAYVLVDAIVDEYFTMQDSFDELIETVEDELLANPTTKTLTTIQKIRRELIFLRRNIAPLRELLKSLHRSSESPLLEERTRRYFGDVYDHVIRISEAVESYRDLIASMLDIYLSSVSNKMNETMKVLTVFASIFIPLTFIAGVYGMNFEYMPELKWRWGYPALWSVFIFVSVFLLAYFKRKKWL